MVESRRENMTGIAGSKPPVLFSMHFDGLVTLQPQVF
jgi:hypothetical protein